MKASQATVSDILKRKGDTVSTIKPNDTIASLSQRLREEQVGALVVSDDGRVVDGIISERDIAYALAEHRGKLHDMPVSSLMTKAVITCGPDVLLEDAAAVLRERRIRHLPVIDEGRIVGMIGMRDILVQRLDSVRHSTKKATTLISTNA